jgi:hypothetical protein
MWFHFSSLHFTSRHIVSLISLDFNRFHLVSLYFTCFYFGSLELTWFHVMSLEFTWFHFISLYFTLVSLDFTCVHLVSSYFTWFHFISLCFTWVLLRGESDYKMCIPLLGPYTLGDCACCMRVVHWCISSMLLQASTASSSATASRCLPQHRGAHNAIAVALGGSRCICVYVYMCIWSYVGYLVGYLVVVVPGFPVSRLLWVPGYNLAPGLPVIISRHHPSYCV